VVTQGTSRGKKHTGNIHDGNSTQTATVAVVTQGTSRGEEQPGNTHNDNSTQGATAKIGVNGSNYFKEETGHKLSFTVLDRIPLLSSTMFNIS
jgi:hypothetical protein